MEMVSKTENSKQMGMMALDKKRTRIILNHIKKHNPTSDKSAVVIENGKPTKKTSMSLPREFLRLNPFNHRFTTSLQEIIDERIENNKSKNFNMDKKEDIEQIRNMLRGDHPTNLDRKNSYKKLLDEVKNSSELYGGNGLTDACIITADGTFVNGNRRDVVLEDLQELETAKKKGGNPDKFDMIDVVICNENITYSDIRQMEIKEQVSINLRDEYDYMNTALLIKEEYDNLILQKGEEKKKQVIKIIASRIAGKSDKSIHEYLDFLEFVDSVLDMLQLKNQYHKINTQIPGESKPVTTILKEWQQKSSGSSNKRKFLQLNIAAAYCQGVFKTAKKPDDEIVYKFNTRNHRTFKNYSKSKKAEELLENMEYWKDHDFTSDESVNKFGDLIQRAEEYKKNELWITKPRKMLDSISSSLEIIDIALVGTRNKEVRTELQKAKVMKRLDEFKKRINSIEKKMGRSK